MIETFLTYLSQHTLLAYLILFLGAYFETLVGTSLLIHGEIFFLAGGILAGMGYLNIWIITPIIFLAGFLGDTSSYFIGRHYGMSFLRKLPYLHKYATEEYHERGSKIFAKYGAQGVLVARFMGPMAWVTPFFAGVYHLPLKKFIIYDILGVMLGIGQFIIIGYVFGQNYQIVLDTMSHYAWYVAGLALVLALFIFFWIKRKK
jgi:membrane-associated protein